MSKIYVWSTLTADQRYTLWKKGGADLQIKDRGVLIKGGANVANKHLQTPRGVMTQVTAEQLEILEACPSFLRHKERGFIKVEQVEVAVEKVISDMVQRSPDAPLVPEDYEPEKAAAIKTNLPPKPPKGVKNGK